MHKVYEADLSRGRLPEVVEKQHRAAEVVKCRLTLKKCLQILELFKERPRQTNRAVSPIPQIVL